VTRDQIVEHINEQIGEEEAEEIVLFDGMEPAFLGIAERFEKGGHRYFAVYSYRKMVNALRGPFGRDMTREDACEYLEFNTVGLYAGPNTPAIMRDLE
jgi:hypothetical protein